MKINTPLGPMLIQGSSGRDGRDLWSQMGHRVGRQAPHHVQNPQATWIVCRQLNSLCSFTLLHAPEKLCVKEYPNRKV